MNEWTKRTFTFVIYLQMIKKYYDNGSNKKSNHKSNKLWTAVNFHDTHFIPTKSIG